MYFIYYTMFFPFVYHEKRGLSFVKIYISFPLHFFRGEGKIDVTNRKEGRA